MIKQLTVENLFNFKEEIIIDFITSGKSAECSYTYNKDKISNFTVFYGKNNVGKTNLFRIISYAKDFIQNAKMRLEPYKPEANVARGSIFEIILENDVHEVRYGFELLISKKEIKDEWMYAKLNNSPRESLIFSRSSLKMHFTFKKNALHVFLNTKKNRLFLSHFKNVPHEYDVISSFLKDLESITFVDCVHRMDSTQFSEQIISFSGNKNKMELFNAFLLAADLDIKRLDVQEISSAETLLLEELRSIMMSDDDETIKNERIREFSKKNTSLMGSLLGKELILAEDRKNGDQKINYAVANFLHQNGAIFGLNQVSTGTRQIANLISTLVENIERPSIYLFDEIETGLHAELINLIVNLLKLTLNLTPQNQFLITTHREEILDLDYIPNDNKILLKYDKKQKSPYLEYISQYKIREYQRLSDRYRLDAFDSNPNTAYEYRLFNILKDMAEKERDNES